MTFQRKIECSLLILLTISRLCFANGLSENSRVSILTIDPGEELYTIFGHTALRIQDSEAGIDNVYNFGTFDFQTPFFYIKFLKGNLDYFLSIDNYESFLAFSASEQRRVHEQTLDLDYPYRQQIYARLNHIYRSDERYYRYDFFYDNCATRIRDAILSPAHLQLHYDTTAFCCKTFRQLLEPFISNRYLVNLGVNLALGREADKTAGSLDFMFLPFYLFHILEASSMVYRTEILVDAPSGPGKPGLFSLIFPYALVLTVAGLSWFRKTRSVIFYALNALVALTGIILLLMTLFSLNSAFRDNASLMWTLPALIILLTRNRVRKTVEIVTCVLLIVLLIAGKKIYPGFSWTFIPWILSLIILYLTDLHLLYPRGDPGAVE